MVSRPNVTAGQTYDVNLLTPDCTICAFTAVFLGWNEEETVATFNNDVLINGWEFEALPRP